MAYNPLENSYNLYGDETAGSMDPKNFNFMGQDSGNWFNSNAGQKSPYTFGGFNSSLQQSDQSGGWWDALKGMLPQAASSWQPYMGLAGTGMGIASSIMAGRQQDAYNKQLSQFARQPIDINRYYQPLSAAAEAAIRRGVAGDVAARGIQPGGYWDNQMAEVMANTEMQRRTEAARLAAMDREGGLQALMGRRPTMPMMGGLDAFGKAMALYETQQGRQQAAALQARRDAQTKEAMDRIFEMLRTGRGNTPQYNIPISNTSDQMDI